MVTAARRTVLKTAAFAAAAATLPLRTFDPAVAAEPAGHGVFGYGVASGDPLADRVIIWTRATPPGRPVAYPGSGLGGPLEVAWEVATDARFRHIVRHGRVRTDASRDHTVKVDVTGLHTYARYYYRFRAAGQTSPIGRTRTAPDNPERTHALRFALVSCSNYTGGYFGAYRALARRDDLDFVLHVGDYLYEYGNTEARYGPDELRGKRDVLPPHEVMDLAGYRLRHALHKADPDLQAAHRVHPFITIFDDHEIANNAWHGGAGNHRAGVEGVFHDRRHEALTAYLEWMPFRVPDQHDVPHRGSRFFRRFTFGTLADLSVIETRQNRSRQIDVAPYSEHCGGFIPDGMHAVDEQLADPSRHLPEPEQMHWLKKGVSQPRDWHLIGNQVMLTPMRFPGSAVGHPEVRRMLNSDQWDGYQADQHELISHLAAQPVRRGDAVVLTGDIHSSWAMDIPTARTPYYRSAGVEFVCPSVSSDGFYEGRLRDAAKGTAAESVVRATRQAMSSIVRANPWVQYLDGVGHGYTVVDVTPERVQGDWFLTPTPTASLPDPRLLRSTVPSYRASFATPRGSRRVTRSQHRLTARHDEPHDLAGTALAQVTMR